MDAWLPLPTTALLFPLAISCRLSGLVFALLALVAYIRLVRRGAGAITLIVLCLLTVAASALPVDTTLQNLPGGPRMVPVISGLNVADPSETVIIGGCAREYHYPRWAFVW